MNPMNKSKFEQIMSEHDLWMQGSECGKRACFENEMLTNMDLSNHTFINVIFSKTDFGGTELTNTKFYDCVLDDCSLKRAHVLGVCLINCDICKLTVDHNANGVSILS